MVQLFGASAKGIEQTATSESRIKGASKNLRLNGGVNLFFHFFGPRDF